MRIGYMFKKIKNANYKEYYNRAKEIAKKINKSTFYVLFDMAKCAILYGSGYMDYFEFEFYLLNKSERKTYITGRYNNEIIRKYNKKEDWDKFSDKVKFNNLFKDYLNRGFLDLRSVSFKEFESFIEGKSKIVVKPINGSGGKGVEVIELDSEKMKNEYNVLKIYNSIIKNEQFLVEDFIVQHEEMSKLYGGSVNGVRVLSFLDDQGETHIMNVILRIGHNGSVDNFSSGGMYTFVNKEGKVFVPAIDEDGHIYNKHPKTLTPIVGFKVPNYDKLEGYVKELCKVVPTVRYVGWDLAVTKDGFVLLEGNEYPGIFQVKPSISGIKTGDLVKYRKYMDI